MLADRLDMADMRPERIINFGKVEIEVRVRNSSDGKRLFFDPDGMCDHTKNHNNPLLVGVFEFNFRRLCVSINIANERAYALARSMYVAFSEYENTRNEN